jgi:hypothetical protein
MTPSQLAAYPNALAWLEQQRTALEDRTGSFGQSNWFEYSRRQNLERFAEPKILIPYMVEELCAYFDTGAHYFVNVSTGGYGIPAAHLEDPAFLVALLSSTLLSWHLRRRSRSWRGGWFAARKGNLSRLPIIEAAPVDRAEVTDAFDRCAELRREAEGSRSDSDERLAANALRRAARGFDMSVYDLYGLSAADRGVVEDL